jgi:hypothetical protein
LIPSRLDSFLTATTLSSPTGACHALGSHLAGETLRQVEADKENAEYQERRKRNTGHQAERTVTANVSFVSHM